MAALLKIVLYYQYLPKYLFYRYKLYVLFQGDLYIYIYIYEIHDH